MSKKQEQDLHTKTLLALICIFFLISMLGNLALNNKFNDIRIISDVPAAYAADERFVLESIHAEPKWDDKCLNETSLRRNYNK